MSNYKIIIVLFSAIIIAMLFGCGGETADENELPLILVVNSYYTDYNWVQTLNASFEEGFEKEKWVEGEDFQIQYYYMDTKRNPGKEFVEKAGKDALEKVYEVNPDVVIVIAENAMEYVGVKLLNNEEGIPVVFAGTNYDPVDYYRVADSYREPGNNITGCLHISCFSGTVELLHEIVPDAKKVAFIDDDSTVAPPHTEKAMGEAEELGLEVVMQKQISTFEDWKVAVEEANKTADFIHLTVYHTLTDEEGEIVVGKDVLEWTVENSNIPVTSTWMFTVREGALCSEAITARLQALKAVEIAKLIAIGREPGKIPIENNLDGYRVVNETTATKLGIELSEEITGRYEVVK